MWKDKAEIRRISGQPNRLWRIQALIPDLLRIPLDGGCELLMVWTVWAYWRSWSDDALSEQQKEEACWIGETVAQFALRHLEIAVPL